ncbi:DUF6403 family protein [Prauserella muralis]|uniref:Uncharacterized protein n=1 Tax=Prauserella muralis TaxID=588067 RepID=A0A2V4AKL3_9PSEU|nr:DUF6403 family protein [Prauserella muralis]PXY19383.1 hypothetical protein BAY60_32050 [Prauserella muralis]TWE29350.1 hypothetical protein FHX69_2034 [Prauserella muralis]
MTLTWLGWLAGVLGLVAAGFGAVLLPRRRARAGGRATAWSTARSAIDIAAVSRDACPARVAEAEHLLARAESLAADRGGVAAAHQATEYARRADRLWRQAADA